MPDGQHQTALGQCRYVDHKKNIFGTSTSTSTTVSCSRKVLLLAYVACFGVVLRTVVWEVGQVLRYRRRREGPTSGTLRLGLGTLEY